MSHGRFSPWPCFTQQVPHLKPGWDWDAILQAIVERGVPCFSCSEVYLEKNFQDAGLAPEQRLPVARELGETSLAFLCHPTLTAAEIGKTCGVVGEVMALAAG